MKCYRLIGSLLYSLLLIFSTLSCSQHVRIGAEILLEKHLSLLQGKNVGIICNHTSLLPDGTDLVDALLSKGVTITALFAPEHGIRGIVSAGEHVTDSVDAKTGIRIFSLYGKNRKPTPDMLKNVDVLLFDLQDVGARFYTYASTMAYVMQAAAENYKKIIVLDRPNPIGGIDIDGPVLDTTLKSFLGMFPIPIRHGLTLGELAKMIVGERWMNNVSNLDLTVITMEGWKREMYYDETGLPWIPPSPNMKTLLTAIVYPGTCLFEATNVSEGRGTPYPFQYIGAPWMNGKVLSEKLNALHLQGVEFLPQQFTPIADSVSGSDPKYKGKSCQGVNVTITGRAEFHPVLTAIAILQSIAELYPDSLQIKTPNFEMLSGSKQLRGSLKNAALLKTFTSERESLLVQFKQVRIKYLLY